MRSLVPILLTAVGYYVAGRLSLLLALPPGYATAVWPAAGLALAAVLLAGNRVWIGVLIGSFCVNVGTSFDASTTQAILRSLVIASIIGGGASLQALVGGWLVRRFTDYGNVLTQEFGALRILILGGPLACIINASVSVTALWSFGLIQGSNYLFSWWTWWVGDSIGVLIITPLLLVLSLRPHGKWRRQKLLVTLPMVAMFAVVVAMFVFISDREQAGVQGAFEKQAERFNHELGKDLDVYLNSLSAIVGFYDGSEHVNLEEFTHFARRMQKRVSDAQALSWNAHIKHADREAFENKLRASIWPDYRIYEVGAEGPVPAGIRPEYFPVVYTIPYERNSKAIGYDIGSESVRKAAILKSLETNAAAATGPIQLVQFETEPTGILILQPTFRDGSPDKDLLGLAVVVIRVIDLVSSAANVIGGAGIQVFMADTTDSGAHRYLYSSTGRSVSSDLDSGLNYSSRLDVAGREWRIDFHIPPDYLIAHSSWEAWTFLAIGMLLTALLGAMVLIGVGHAARTAAVVEARTRDLNKVNEEIAEKNKELESFAYIVSHDLQAPLRAMTGFVQLLDERYREKFDEDGREFLKYIVDGAAQMRQMIFDILALSRVSSAELERATVDVNAVMAQVRSALQADIAESDARLEYESLPQLQADDGQLLQLFQNLVGNAIKFRTPDRAPVVRIETEQTKEGWHFKIADNGIGISKEKQDQLFVLFSRLHTTEEYPGTGLGLAICKRIVERHGGRIWLDSEAGKGTTFHFILPA